MPLKNVFISYSNKDKYFVNQLIADLKKKEIDVWEYSTQIELGNLWQREVNKAIKKADHFLIVLSPNSVKSELVNEELDKAVRLKLNKKRKDFIIPILYQDCDLPDPISSEQFINFASSYQLGLKQLLKVTGQSKPKFTSITLRGNLDLSKIELTSNQELYKSIGLSFNPFPSTPISWEEQAYPPVNSMVVTGLQEFITRTYNSHESGMLSITGDYGSGKSHILKYVETQINLQLGKSGEDKAIAITLLNPPASTINVVFEFIRSIARSRFTKFLWDTVFREITNGLSNPLTKRFLDNTSLTTAQIEYFSNSSNYRDFLREINSTESREWLREIINSSLGQYFEYEPYVNRLRDLMLEDESSSYWEAWRVLTGENLNEAFKLERRFPARDQFAGVLKVLRDLGYRHIYLLIDEFTEIALSEQDQMDKNSYLVDLDDLIRTNVNYFSLIIALATKAWDALVYGNRSFTDRFEQISIPNLDIDEAKTLINNYFERAKLADKDTPTVRFDKGAIDYIISISHGNMRAFLSSCHEVVEASAQKGIPIIDQAFASKALGG